jgi:hypothetical protein
MNKPTKEISFTNTDKVCVIDADMWPVVCDYKWSVIRSYTKTKDVYYAVAQVRDGYKCTTLLMHRLLTNCPKGKVVDHLNHDGLDNRMANLKVCTYSENMLNARKYNLNT